MFVRVALLSVALATMFAACGGDGPSPPDTGPGGDVVELTGGERLGWDQRASSPTELASLRFVLYVDGSRMEFQEASCGALSGDQTACVGTLPPLSVGEHTLELSASSDGAESGRSSPLRVSVLRTAALSVPRSLRADPSVPAADLPADTTRVTLRELASGLDDPTDLAVVPDGRVFIAERAGRLRVLDAGTLVETAMVLDDVRSSRGIGGLLSFVLDPDFERTHFIYAVYTTDEGFRLARFRERNNALGERVILLDGISASPAPVAVLRFGPDAKLYLALDDGGEPSRAGDFGSYNGKLLRLNADGTAPGDQAGLTPVFAVNIGAARGFDWDLTAKTLWVAQGIAAGSGTLAAVIDEGDRGRRGRVVARYLLPERAVPSSVVVYRHQLIPAWHGDLLVALPGERQLLRLGLDPDGSGHVIRSEAVLDGAAGQVRALGVASDGAVYLANDSSLLVLAPDDSSRGF